MRWTSYDIYFEPKELSIPADTDVTVHIPNEGVTLHNFSIDELGISVDIEPGATEEAVINAPAGDYEYYCNVPGHKAGGHARHVDCPIALAAGTAALLTGWRPC